MSIRLAAVNPSFGFRFLGNYLFTGDLVVAPPSFGVATGTGESVNAGQSRAYASHSVIFGAHPIGLAVQAPAAAPGLPDAIFAQ